ncbi:MAG: efflux RND transporter permease subunit, partial [Steroidobacteraceae bacterium]
MTAKYVLAMDRLIFTHRAAVLVLFTLVTLGMAFVAFKGLRIDAGFEKQLPRDHEYIQTFLSDKAKEFRGANRVLIAVLARDGNMFTPEFFKALKTATDEVFFIDGIDRAFVQSLYTPNVRYTEIVEDGIEAGNVVPAEFEPTPEAIAKVRENILKAGIVGRLVANDFSGAIVSAQIADVDPSGKPVDLIRLAHDLESKVRAKIQGQGLNGVDVSVQGTEPGAEVHMIGFAKVMGDIADGAGSVVMFAGITIVLTLLFVWIYCQSFRIALIPVVCSIIAVVWQLGLLVLVGFGIDPIGILVPFLIFAIGVSHGVQKVSAVGDAAFSGADSMEAARQTFRRLLLPAVVALIADLVGFITILIIPVRVIQEMAVTASLGVGVVILTDLLLLPVLVSFVPIDDKYRDRLRKRMKLLAPLWDKLSVVARRGPATAIIVIGIGLGAVGWLYGHKVAIGDSQAGVPELWPDSRYNKDSNLITKKFSIGVDILNVIVETNANGCVDYDVISAIDRFTWHMANVPGVQDAVSLGTVMKIASSAWNEGSLKWRNLPRNEAQLVQAQKYIETSTGLLNADCSVMPVVIFTKDHKAETIATIVTAVKKWRSENKTPNAQFLLATGNVGVMAATNEVVKAKEMRILAGVFISVIVMCLVTFRSVLGTICVVLPLALVSVLVYAVMTFVGIGLKISTLPMVALGAGIGVDYGIYLYSRMQEFLHEGQSVQEAYRQTLRVTGNSIVFTGITLAIGVVTWAFSPLKFQADIGIMLTF